ncbi:MAG: hypothetical protein IPH85_08810 [Ignavibacteria bacterium]|nr:hypothetical protein [Ignavibacteria bacterium]MBK7411591.1 hypothetical protein [Ignavibacteria bacterium]MBL0322646.1 hypothetical protein [Ignavibacteria bacterium]
MRSSTKWFLAILLGISVGIAAFFIWYRTQSMSVEGFYVETDGFTDSRGDEIASVHFVKVEAYDSLKILRVAEEITRTTIESNTLDASKKRRFLFHFYVGSDTTALSPEMIDELAYTNPSIEDPSTTLHVIPSGYVISATFAPTMLQPQAVESRRTQFYMPKPGIRAQSVK